LVKDFWVRAEVYDEEAAELEEWQKITEDLRLKGKTRKDMGLEDFKKVEIRSAMLGIRVTIKEEIIAKAARCSRTGKFQLGVKKNNRWIEKIDKT